MVPHAVRGHVLWYYGYKTSPSQNVCTQSQALYLVWVQTVWRFKFLIFLKVTLKKQIGMKNYQEMFKPRVTEQESRPLHIYAKY